MKVKELIRWLATFEDQDADVKVVEHSRGTGYYDQGGNARMVAFDPEKHAKYTDMRGNQFAKPDAPHYEARTLLLGEVDA